MKRGAKIALGVAAALVLVVGGLAFYAFTPGKAKPFDDPVHVATRESNTAGSVALVRLGIENYTVDTSDERILLAYELPRGAAGNLTREEAFQRMVLAAGAAAAPQSEHVVAMQVRADEPVHVWSAKVSDFRAYEAGEITAEELDARIQRVSPAAA